MSSHRQDEGDEMSELTDALFLLLRTLHSQYNTLRPIILHHLHAIAWSARLSLLETKEDLVRPFRRYSDHILLLDSPDEAGWQVCLQVEGDDVRCGRVQHLGRGKLGGGVRLAVPSKQGRGSSGAPGAAGKEGPREAIVHLARLPRSPSTARQMILQEIERVLREDLLDSPEWILRDAVKGAKRRCLREGAGMEWCDVWLAGVVKRRPGAIVQPEGEGRGEGKKVPQGKVVGVLAKLVP